MLYTGERQTNKAFASQLLGSCAFRTLEKGWPSGVTGVFVAEWQSFVGDPRVQKFSKAGEALRWVVVAYWVENKSKPYNSLEHSLPIDLRR